MMSLIKSWLLNSLHFLKLDELDVPTQAKMEFEALYEAYIQKGEGELIEYECKYPKYLFLNYLIEQKNVLVHGSNHRDIEEFSPRRQTLFTGKPVQAVFAASDGVWSSFFAVINRKDYVGSLRNACYSVRTKKGIKRYYYFSLNEAYKESCWVDGMMYILPKHYFNQGGIKDEWICETTVMPLAKLAIQKNDFIFINHVKRHRESDTILKMILKALINKS